MCGREKPAPQHFQHKNRQKRRDIWPPAPRPTKMCRLLLVAILLLYAHLACLGPGVKAQSVLGNSAGAVQTQPSSRQLGTGPPPPPWNTTCGHPSGWAHVLQRYMGHWDVVALVAWHPQGASEQDGGARGGDARTGAVVRELALCAAPLALTMCVGGTGRARSCSRECILSYICMCMCVCVCGVGGCA